MGKYGINKIVMLKNGVLLIRFEAAVGKKEVIEGGIYHFDNKLFIVKAWAPEMEFTRDELNTIPIWIKFPGLDFKYWSPKGLSKIWSLIGRSMMVDQNTERKNELNFARLLVEVEMRAILPDTVCFKTEKRNSYLKKESPMIGSLHNVVIARNMDMMCKYVEKTRTL